MNAMPAAYVKVDASMTFLFHAYNFLNPFYYPSFLFEYFVA